MQRARPASLVACACALLACNADGTGMETGPVSAGSTAVAVVSGSGGIGLAAGSGASGSSATTFAGSGAAGAMTGASGGAAGGAAAGMSAAAGTNAAAGTGAAGSAAGTGGVAGAAGAAGTAGAAGAAAGSGGAGGAGGASGASGGGGSAGAAGGGGGAPTFTEIYGLIVDQCNGCHALGDGGLNMGTKTGAYTNLVDASSRACSGQKRVVPMKPEASVMFHAVNRTSLGSCNPPDMPRGGTKWSQANIDKLKAWIMAGAPND